MTRPLILRLALLGALLPASQALAAEADSKAFIQTAIQGNLTTIALGKLADQKGGSPAVKSFGQTLVADHNKANQSAFEVAKGMDVKMPTELDPTHKARYDSMAKEPTKAFDADFVNEILQDHQLAITAYQKEAAEGDAAGAYAKAQLPVLEAHLAAVQKLARDLGI